MSPRDLIAAPPAASETTAPPRPVLALQIGAVGHRRLLSADGPALLGCARTVFRALRDEALRLHAADQACPAPLFAPAPPILRCLSALAEGSDRVLADAALAEGWALASPLPFPRAEYERDFATADSRQHFRALCARAETVFELHGARERGAEPYETVGMLLLEQSDLLVAIWDGLPARGLGGTGQVMGAALDGGMAIAALSPGPPHATAVFNVDGGRIEAVLPALLLPAAAARASAQVYFASPLRAARFARAVVGWYDRLAVLGAQVPQATAPLPCAPPYAGQVEPIIRPYFAAADRFAIEYALRHRSAGLLRFGMVLPATLGALIGFYAPPPFAALGFLLQFVSLVAIVLLFWHGTWDAWHQRFVDSRFLAEWLRQVPLFAPLGAVPELPGTPVHLARTTDWVSWHVRAAVREVGLVQGTADPATVRQAAAAIDAHVAGQVAFYRARAGRFAVIVRRLHRIGFALFLCGILFAAARFAVVIGGVSAQSARPLNQAALVLPALAPVFLGLLGFGEYGRLAERYSATAAELDAARPALAAAAGDWRRTLRIARRIAGAMLAEISDWRVLIRGRGVSPC